MTVKEMVIQLQAIEDDSIQVLIQDEVGMHQQVEGLVKTNMFYYPFEGYSRQKPEKGDPAKRQRVIVFVGM